MDKLVILCYSLAGFYCICLTFSVVLIRGKDKFSSLLRGLIWDPDSFDPLKGAARKELRIEFNRYKVWLRRMMCK